MSIYALNRATDSRRGNGLPFYDKLDYVFSARNNCFNSTEGLYFVPNGKLPTFMLEGEENVVSLTYKETRGGNDFTGAIFSIPLAHVYTKMTIVNGTERYFHYTKESDILIPKAPAGRYLLELVLNDGVSNSTYYSEEFVVKTCC